MYRHAERPRVTSRSDSDLPAALSAVVPSCAVSCVSADIDQQYNCPDDQLDCLCTSYSSGGYSLGELSLSCLALDCPDASQSQRLNVFGICSAQTGAVQPTHSILTIEKTASSSTKAGIATTTQTVTSSATPLGQTSATLPTSLSSLLAVATTAAPTTPRPTSSTPSTSTTATSSATPPAVATSSHPSTSLTSGQAVGVSIAAMGVVIAAVGVIFLIACIKRRRAHKKIDEKQDYDFVDEAPPRFSPFNYGHADPRGPLGGFTKPRSELSTDRTAELDDQTLPTQNGQLKQYKTHRVSPESVHSNKSTRTVSQLLPEKPDATTASARAPNRPSRSATMQSPATVFEEERSPRIPSILAIPLPPKRVANLPGRDVKPAPYHDPLLASSAPTRQPSLSLQIPHVAPRSAKIPSPVALPSQPKPIYYTATDPRAHSQASATGSMLDYYASAEAGVVPAKTRTPKRRERKSTPAAINVPKPAYPPRAVRQSQSSDTSFESTDPDEPTPPDEDDKSLSPVAERSPIAAIRYPKVPRSSNQSIPRSPARNGAVPRDGRTGNQMPTTPEQRLHTPNSALSGSTLAGLNTLAGKRLYIDTAHSRSRSHHKPQSSQGSSTRNAEDAAPSTYTDKHDSPLRGYGRVTSGGSKPSDTPFTPDMRSAGPRSARGYPIAQEAVLRSPLRSPLWEPKLTPSRRGGRDGDLFLEVGLASPMSGMFGPMRDSYHGMASPLRGEHFP